MTVAALIVLNREIALGRESVPGAVHLQRVNVKDAAARRPAIGDKNGKSPFVRLPDPPEKDRHGLGTGLAGNGRRRSGCFWGQVAVLGWALGLRAPTVVQEWPTGLPFLVLHVGPGSLPPSGR